MTASDRFEDRRRHDRYALARHELKTQLTVIRIRTQLVQRIIRGARVKDRAQLLADLAAIDVAVMETAARVDRLVRCDRRLDDEAGNAAAPALGAAGSVEPSPAP